MSAAHAVWPRWRILAAMFVAQGVFVWLLSPLPDLVLDRDCTLGEAAATLLDAEVIKVSVIATVILAGLQAALLWPVRKPVVGAGGRSLWLTAAAASLAGTMLLAALVALLADVAYLAGTRLLQDELPTEVMLSAAAASWLMFTPLMMAFLRRPDPARLEGRLSRLSSRLLMGTAIEVVASIPIAIMVRRKTDCYCGMGTFWAMFAYIGLGALLVGPAAILPILARRRRAWYNGHCGACGYDMQGLREAARCPECGSGWRAPSA